jgi:hypothetical protein
VLNNPLGSTDPLGLQAGGGTGEQEGEYRIEGVDVPSYIFAALAGGVSGALVNCYGWCDQINKTVPAPNNPDSGVTYTLVVGAGGPVWINNVSGLEMSSASDAELGLGLPHLASGEQSLIPANTGNCSGKKTSFIKANSIPAAKVASQLKVPTANILGLAAEETGWGTSSIALNAHNFFGIHAGAPGNIGTYTTNGGATVSMFPASTGFLSSAQSFAVNFGSLVNGISNPTAFAQALVPKFNTANAANGGNPNFVRLVSGTIRGVSACE